MPRGSYNAAAQEAMEEGGFNVKEAMDAHQPGIPVWDDSPEDDDDGEVKEPQHHTPPNQKDPDAVPEWKQELERLTKNVERSLDNQNAMLQRQEQAQYNERMRQQQQTQAPQRNEYQHTRAATDGELFTVYDELTQTKQKLAQFEQELSAERVNRARNEAQLVARAEKELIEEYGEEQYRKYVPEGAVKEGLRLSVAQGKFGNDWKAELEGHLYKQGKGAVKSLAQIKEKDELDKKRGEREKDKNKLSGVPQVRASNMRAQETAPTNSAPKRDSKYRLAARSAKLEMKKFFGG